MITIQLTTVVIIGLIALMIGLIIGVTAVNRSIRL